MPADHIDGAKHSAFEERRRLNAEMAAFDDFLTRLESLTTRSPSTPPSTVPAGQQSTLTASAPSPVAADTGAIEDAYRETIMAVGHYEEDYGDTYLESVAEEFGEQVAAALGSDAALTPFLKDQLRQVVHRAIDDRRHLLDGIESELAVLDETVEDVTALRNELTAIRSRSFFECSRTELERLERDVAHLRTRCESLVSARQATLRKQHRILKLPAGFPHLAMYLYQDLDITYPVLATYATLGQEIWDTQQELEAHLAPTPA